MKLLAAVSLLFPANRVPDLIVLVALSGGVLALGVLAWRALRGKLPVRDAQSGDAAAVSGSEGSGQTATGYQGDGLPYAVAILFGTLANMAIPV